MCILLHLLCYGLWRYICQSAQGVVLMCSNYELKLSNTADGRRLRDRTYDLFFLPWQSLLSHLRLKLLTCSPPAFLFLSWKSTHELHQNQLWSQTCQCFCIIFAASEVSANTSCNGHVTIIRSGSLNHVLHYRYLV